MTDQLAVWLHGLRIASVERIHQEDCCQAFGFPAARKYQQEGGPSLRRIALLLRTYDLDAVPVLMRTTTFNVVIGNADAHAKNFSLLHARPGDVRLAPFYDELATRLYPDVDDHLAMEVAGVQRLDRVTPEHLVEEGRSWGLPRSQAEDLVHDTLRCCRDAIAPACAAVPAVPAALPQLVSDRLDRLGRSPAQAA
jgi:serine/threonine-protein kinase HipA